MKKKILITICIAIIFALTATTLICYSRLSDSFNNVVMTNGEVADGSVGDVMQLFSDFNKENFAPYNNAMIDRAVSAIGDKSNKCTAEIKMGTELGDDSLVIRISMNVNENVADGKMTVSLNGVEEDAYQHNFNNTLQDGQLDVLSILNNLKDQKTDWFPTSNERGHVQIFGESASDSTMVIFDHATHELTDLILHANTPEAVLEALHNIDDDNIKSIVNKLEQENPEMVISIKFSDWGK